MAMRNWFKACISLIVIAVIVFFLDAFYNIQIDAYFGYGKIPFFGYYPSVSLFILLIVIIILALAYLAFLMGAKPVLDRELFEKKT